MKTFTPAYGRDYKTAKEACDSWESGQDWILRDYSSPWNGKPANRQDVPGAVLLRFSQNRKVTSFDPDKPKPVPRVTAPRQTSWRILLTENAIELAGDLPAPFSRFRGGDGSPTAWRSLDWEPSRGTVKTAEKRARAYAGGMARQWHEENSGTPTVGYEGNGSCVLPEVPFPCALVVGRTADGRLIPRCAFVANPRSGDVSRVELGPKAPRSWHAVAKIAAASRWPTSPEGTESAARAILAAETVRTC